MCPLLVSRTVSPCCKVALSQGVRRGQREEASWTAWRQSHAHLSRVDSGRCRDNVCTERSARARAQSKMQTVRRASCGAGGEGFLGEGSPNAGKARASRVARMVSAVGQRVAVQLTADEATKRSVDCTVRWSCEARLYLHAPTLREGLEAAVGDECVRGARSASFKSGNPLACIAVLSPRAGLQLLPVCLSAHAQSGPVAQEESVDATPLRVAASAFDKVRYALAASDRARAGAGGDCSARDTLSRDQQPSRCVPPATPWTRSLPAVARSAAATQPRAHATRRQHHAD